MPLTDESKINIALKKIVSKAHTSNDKDPANEANPSYIITLADNVWTDAISSISNKAVSAGVAEAVECDLDIDVTSNGKAYYLRYPTGHAKAGQRVYDIIPDAIGVAYEVIFWRNKGTSTRIFKGDISDWVIDQAVGIITSEGDLSLDANAKCDVFVYIGEKLSNSTQQKVIVEEFTLDSTAIVTTKLVTLSQTPINDEDVKLLVYEGIAQDEGVDYIITGTTLSWNGTPLDGLLEVGDKLQVSYSYQE